MGKSNLSSKIMSAVLGVVLGLVPLTAPAFAGTVFTEVQSNNRLRCGISYGIGGWSIPDENGNWNGFDVDFCRAIAAALFGDANSVTYSPRGLKNVSASLNSGEIHVMAGLAQYSAGGDSIGSNFVPTFHDTIGVLTSSLLGVSSTLELDGAAICETDYSMTNQHVDDYFYRQTMSLSGTTSQESIIVSAKSLFSGPNCDIYAGPVGLLSSLKSTVALDPASWLILPEELDNVVLGLAVREGDEQFTDLVQRVVWAMIRAEELGVTQQNVDTQKTSSDPRVQRLLGQLGTIGPDLGLSSDWAYNIIKQVGNYGEVFDNNLTAIGLSRGRNALYTDGGLMISPAF